MGIQPGHGNDLLRLAQRAGEEVGQANLAQHPVEGDQVDGLAQGDVGRHVEDELAPGGEHQRIVAHAELLGQQLRVARIGVAGQVHGLLVEGRRDDARNVPRLGQFHGSQHIRHRAAARFGGELAWTDVGQGCARLEQVDRCWRVPVRLVCALDDLQARTIGSRPEAQRVCHKGCVAHDDWAAERLHFWLRQRLDNDLRADACGVAHGDGERNG